jgi:hypothetical protein|nr:MAG TPA: hypothetical protein [Caudoviricetes sp.]
MIQVRVAQQHAVSVRITGTAVVSAPEYAGPYDITPLLSAQTLPTAKRLMQQDVIIEKIPQYEVSNDYGTTLILGDEYYGK